jgi:hypothetical protein
MMRIHTLFRKLLILPCGAVMLAGCTLPLRLPEPVSTISSPPPIEQPVSVIERLPEPVSTPTSLPPPIEQPVTVIRLAGPASDRSAEFSAMAWYSDTLVLAPQYPHRFEHQFFYLTRDNIEAYLRGNAPALAPQPLPLLGFEAAQGLAGFEGFEALAFAGNRVYLTVETEIENEMLGHLLTGEIAPDLSALTIYPEPQATIPPQTRIRNFSDEAIVLAGDSVLTFYEVNGFLLNRKPVAHRFAQDSLAPLEPLPSSHLEHRLTDATPLDEEGRFWVINYYFPGDSQLNLGPDPLAVTYGAGPTHSQYPVVERLVEMQYTPEGITLVDAPPIQLQLIERIARNWEGIVRFETPDFSGFLLVTDRFPGTLLAFVPKPEER